MSGDSIDIQQELALLAGSFDDVLESLAQSVAIEVRALAKRIWPYQSNPRWLDHFAPLTSLYPVLQSKGFDGIDSELARSACVAHLCFLVAAFTEDRMQDGQIAHSAETVLAARTMRSEGIRILRRLRSDRNEDVGFEDAEIHAEMLKPDVGGVDEESLAALAPVKARFGFIGTECMLRFSGRPKDELYVCREAFNKTTIALQYADDAADWREDLQIEDDNLLLVRLRDLGFDSYGLPESELRPILVGNALLRHDSIADASRKAVIHLDEAILVQKYLNCRLMAAQLEVLRESIETVTLKIQDQVENEVLAACLMASSVAG